MGILAIIFLTEGEYQFCYKLLQSRVNLSIKQDF